MVMHAIIQKITNESVVCLNFFIHLINHDQVENIYIIVLTSEGIVGCVHFTIVLFWIVLTGALGGGTFTNFIVEENNRK